LLRRTPGKAGCCPCPTARHAPAPERSSEKKISKENDMRSFLGAILAALVFAATIFIMAAAPGFLSDSASTVPVHASIREAGR
jgi:hypothetical protein